MSRSTSTIDFDTKRIGGTARLDIDRKPDAKADRPRRQGPRHRNRSPTASASSRCVTVGAVDQDLGAPLSIALRPDTKQIVITYKSAPEAGALLWLTPEQTAGKKAPFLFSQGEAIENRTWIPTQDSPGDPPDLGSDDPRRPPADGGDERSAHRAADHARAAKACSTSAWTTASRPT